MNGRFFTIYLAQLKWSGRIYTLTAVSGLIQLAASLELSVVLSACINRLLILIKALQAPKT